MSCLTLVLWGAWNWFYFEMSAHSLEKKAQGNFLIKHLFDALDGRNDSVKFIRAPDPAIVPGMMNWSVLYERWHLSQSEPHFTSKTQLRCVFFPRYKLAENPGDVELVKGSFFFFLVRLCACTRVMLWKQWQWVMSLQRPVDCVTGLFAFIIQSLAVSPSKCPPPPVRVVYRW